MALELGVTRRRALIAAAVVIFNPITWFDSVIWGQVDSFGTLFLLLGMRELWRGRHERAAVLAVVAALIKPQLAILVPIVAVVVIRRALWPKGGYGDEGEPPRRGFSFEFRDIGWLRILTTGAAGFLTAVLLSAPFGLTVIGVSSTAPFLDSSLLRLVFSTAATYPYLSVNAYNWWALFPVDGQSVATAGGALWMPDSPVPDAAAWGAIGPVPAALVGAALLLGTAAVVAWVVARRPDRLTILVGVTVLALAFFAAPTRVHERYLFPFFGLAAILFAFSTRWRVAYVVAGIATFLNMYVVLVALYPDNPGVSDWLGIGGAIRSPFGVTTVALLHSAAFIWGVLQLRPGARRALAAQLERGRIEEEALVPEPETRHALATDPGASRAGAGRRRGSRCPADGAGRRPAPQAASQRARHPLPQPASCPPGTTGRPGRRWGRSRGCAPAWARRRSAPTARRASTASREGAWTGWTCSSSSCSWSVHWSCARTGWANPARMHFDEVYHARTATEFLQSWRYGISHDIYEWTHPHLAKYAMAAGIVAVRGPRRGVLERPGRARARRRDRAAPRGAVRLRRPRR